MTANSTDPHNGNPEIRHAWEGTLEEMLDVLAATHIRRGKPEQEARDLAATAVLALAQHMGGRQYYLPKGDSLRQAVRDFSIWREFDGKNIRDLACRYRLTVQRLYQILARQRELQQRRSPIR